MRNLFALIGFAIVAFVGLGWYMGWYNLSRQKGAPGIQSFQVDVNPSKVTSDVKKGAETIGDIYDRLSDDKSAPAQPAATPVPATSSGPATQLFTPSKTNGAQPVSATSSSR